MSKEHRLLWWHSHEVHAGHKRAKREEVVHKTRDLSILNDHLDLESRGEHSRPLLVDAGHLSKFDFIFRMWRHKR